jgi:hypothetical protein
MLNVMQGIVVLQRQHLLSQPSDVWIERSVAVAVRGWDPAASSRERDGQNIDQAGAADAAPACERIFLYTQRHHHYFVAPRDRRQVGPQLHNTAERQGNSARSFSRRHRCDGRSRNAGWWATRRHRSDCTSIRSRIWQLQLQKLCLACSELFASFV